MYPLVLTAEELTCLRLMIRSVVTVRMIQAAEEFRLKARAGDIDDEVLDQMFAARSMALCDYLKSTDTPLFLASIQAKGQTIIANLNEEQFTVVKTVVGFTYVDGGPQDTLMPRIRGSQPALKAAVEVAEEQAMKSVSANVPANHARN